MPGPVAGPLVDARLHWFAGPSLPWAQVGPLTSYRARTLIITGIIQEVWEMVEPRAAGLWVALADCTDGVRPLCGGERRTAGCLSSPAWSTLVAGSGCRLWKTADGKVMFNRQMDHYHCRCCCLLIHHPHTTPRSTTALLLLQLLLPLPPLLLLLSGSSD